MAIINCYDVNGEAIRFLTQWDHDISIRATGVKTSPIPEFRFSNKNSQKSKCISGVVVGDGVKTTIPNGFLQEALPIYVQLFYTYPSGDAKTEHTFVIPVKPASMPDGAVYEPVEVRSIVELEKRVKALEENGVPGAGGVPSDPSFDTVSLGGDAGVVIIPEGTADAPAITFYGARGDEPVALNNVADATDDRSAPNLGQVKQLVKEHSGQNVVRADLSQNDPTQPDYVKHRTHWEENNQTVIEWDGSTEGKDNFLIDDGTSTLCKVSDVVPDIADLNGSIVIVAGIGEFPLSEEMFSQSSWGYSAEVIFGIKNTKFEWDGATYTAPSTGLYFMSHNGAYVSSLTYGSTVVHPLDEKWIPDSIARKTDIHVLDDTLTQSSKAADAKAVGDKLAELEGKIQEGGGTADYPSLTNKPSINGVELNGDKTAEELGITGLTDEQVRTAVDDYIADNPDAITAGATPEQAAQIEFANATDEALFATLESGSLYEVDLSGWAWMDGKVLHYNASSGSWGNHYDGCPGHHYSSGGYIHLLAGDTLITNADSHTAWANGKCTVLRTVAQTAYGWTGNGSPLMYGRGEFDGLYRIYTATEEVRVGVAYQYDVDYDVHFYVARRRTGDGEPVPFRYSAGYFKNATGEVVVGHETNQFVTGYQDNVVSELLTIQAPGKFLLVDNAVYPVGEKGGVVWVRLDADGGLIQQMTSGRWPENKSYYIIPLWNETEYVRFAFKFTVHPAQYTTASIVDAEYLVRHGYAEHMIGKSIAMFGDSYVKGHNMGNNNTWHYMLAEQNQMQYTDLGTNGIGLCKSPNISEGLIDRCETITDADYIGVICGRNDYSTQVPIGTNDDMSTPEMSVGERTFKGGLNYLCKHLVENFPSRKVFFVTPWYFPSTEGLTETHKPVEYIDAILEITGLWGIPCFDAARRSGIHCRSEAFRTTYFLSASDVSHLNATGAKLMLGNINGWMLAL